MKFSSYTALILFLLTASCRLQAALEYPPPTVVNGVRPLALLVGVDDYYDTKIPDLRGAVKDVERFQLLLTGPRGYGFPEENVVTLTNQQATLENFRKTFQEHLVAQARAGDPVVIYFSGHGSQFKDLNKDEEDEDGYDETLLFHDSRASGGRVLLDDDFNLMLQQLYAKTTNLTIIIDACHSGTPTRSGQDRFVPVPDAGKATGRQGMFATIQRDHDYRPAEMPEAIVIGSAGDGTVAYDTPQGGMFSMVLAEELARVYTAPLTYARLESRVRLALSNKRFQIPYFQGPTAKQVLGSDRIFGENWRRQPQCWRVEKIDGMRVIIGGLPMPGLGPGAELHVYDPQTEGAAWLDPGKAKARLVVKELKLTQALTLCDRTREGVTLKQGDLAVLVRPGEDAVTITLSFRPENKPRGLSKELKQELLQAFSEDAEAEMVVEFVEHSDDNPAELEVILDQDNALWLLDKDDRQRSRWSESDPYRAWNLVEAAWRMGRMKALRSLISQGGDQLTENQTLTLDIVPVDDPKTNLLAKDGKENRRTLPAKRFWNIRVNLSEKAPGPMYIAGLLLSANGKINVLPGKDYLRLKPGESRLLNGKNETFAMRPNPQSDDHIIFFATEAPIDWRMMSATADRRNRMPSQQRDQPLFQVLNRYLTPKARTTKIKAAPLESTPWTITTLTLTTK